MKGLCIWSVVGLTDCTPPSKATKETPVVANIPEFSPDLAKENSPLLLDLLNQVPDSLKEIIQNPRKFRLQVIYTQINRDKINKPSFSHHYFNLDTTYTYPASTVKFPAAVLALEKLNKLGIDGVGMNTHMFTSPLRPGEKPVFEDVSSKSGKPSVGHYVKKILLVSDNDAHNRLYEFLGQEGFNTRLHELGFKRAQMTHRLSLPLSDADNRLTNPIWFTDSKGKEVYRMPFANSALVYASRADSIGKGYMTGGGVGKPDILVNNPMDFSLKNRWPISYAHQLTQWVMFPESQTETQKLLLSASDYQFLWKYMSMLPGESDYPAYPEKDYWPAYVKFLWAGSEEGPWNNPNIRIFNKVGNAYGHLLDAAYIVDFDNKVEFLLSAVIYCNADEILNDDRYDYDKIGFPFLKWLGQTVYQYELKREKKILPDLTRFRMDYKR